MKYIVVTGGVMSGLGKGITTASIGRLLKNRGYQVTAVKIDPYLNIDAGTMNPAQHGEVFVLSDGAEVDLDLETMNDSWISTSNPSTTSRPGRSTGVSSKRAARRLLSARPSRSYLTSPTIRHRSAARHGKINGGRTAEIWSGGGRRHGRGYREHAVFRTIRQMHADLAPQDMVLIHVTLVPVDAMGDLKTKPTQHSVKALRELGLQPDIIVGRSGEVIGPQTKKKISAFTDVPTKAVISAKDVPDIYQIPVELEKEGIAEVVCNYLGIENRDPDPAWYRVVSQEYTNRVTVAIVSKCGIEDVYMSARIAQTCREGSLHRGEHPVAGCGGVHPQRPRRCRRHPGPGRVWQARHRRQDPGHPVRRRTRNLTSASASASSLGGGVRHMSSASPTPPARRSVTGRTSSPSSPGWRGSPTSAGRCALGTTVTLREGTMIADLYGTAATVERHRHRYG